MPPKLEVSIRSMRQEDLAFATVRTSAEGWVSENLSTLQGFFLHDPGGCLVAEVNQQPVGICIATLYGISGFVGELIVHPDARGKGVGAALLTHAVHRLKQGGAQTIYLDGVLKALALYERNGFHKVCRSWRFSGRLEGHHNRHVRRMLVTDLDQVFALDKLSFSDDRSFFLGYRFELFPELCHVMLDGSRLTGFILGRRGDGWATAGPWVVSELAQNPADLLYAFALNAGDIPISIGILAVNQRACELVRTLGFVEREDSPWRMALGSSVGLGQSNACYAVGSAAKG